MSRKMKDSGIQWIGEIPEEWTVAKYKYYCKSGMGETILSEVLVDNGIPVYSATLEDKIFGFVSKSKINLLKDDFVIPARGNSIGYVTIVKDKLATCTQTTIYSKIVGINKKFLYYCCYGLKEHWFEFDNTAIPQITVNQIQNNIVPTPNKIEQQKIADFLDEKTQQIENIIKKQNEILENLKTYKQSLITETVTKGLNPNVKMKDSKVEWIGEIPDTWKIKKIKYLGTCQNGISKSAEEFGSGYPFVSYGDVYKNISLPKNVVGLVNSSENDRKNYSVQEGDVFFTRTSETIEEIGFTSVCLKTIENATFAGFIIRFRPEKNILNKNYSKYYFRSQKHRVFFVKEMNLVTRASLSQELLKRLPILLPPLEEQQQIATFLDKKCKAIDDSITKKQELIEKLEIYKKSLIYECVTGKRKVK
ncbi:restriction endonuclease subunit S [Clostridium sp. ZS1]|uniref:restriction endonuclease subunit S n=1 Tax=Clostridium sp. ZS1 TaxID=2949989 RepID=UPI002079711E|nr:restriction endonuclease subunit S [Clostridium sp. ZS1]